jgi:hypothetical protein
MMATMLDIHDIDGSAIENGSIRINVNWETGQTNTTTRIRAIHAGLWSNNKETKSNDNHHTTISKPNRQNLHQGISSHRHDKGRGREMVGSDDCPVFG